LAKRRISLGTQMRRLVTQGASTKLLAHVSQHRHLGQAWRKLFIFLVASPVIMCRNKATRRQRGIKTCSEETRSYSSLSTDSAMESSMVMTQVDSVFSDSSDAINNEFSGTDSCEMTRQHQQQQQEQEQEREQEREQQQCLPAQPQLEAQKLQRVQDDLSPCEARTGTVLDLLDTENLPVSDSDCLSTSRSSSDCDSNGGCKGQTLSRRWTEPVHVPTSCSGFVQRRKHELNSQKSLPVFPQSWKRAHVGSELGNNPPTRIIRVTSELNLSASQYH